MNEKKQFTLPLAGIILTVVLFATISLFVFQEQIGYAFGVVDDIGTQFAAVLLSHNVRSIAPDSV